MKKEEKQRKEEQERKQYIKQIEETKKLVEKNEISTVELTNALLSLVVLPYEKREKGHGRVFAGRYEELAKKIGICPLIFSPIEQCVKGNVKWRNKNIYSFVNKLRNGIAHQNLQINVDENKQVQFEIWNCFSCSECKKCELRRCEAKNCIYKDGKVIDFKIKVTANELKKLAFYIANSYLNVIKEK